MNLPSKVEFQLMSLLAHGEKTGRELAKAYREETKRSISYGTLYTTMRRLEDQRWVSSREDQDEDGRLKFFTLEPAGRAAVRAARAEFKALSLFGMFAYE